jgi:hypothetical protein
VISQFPVNKNPSHLLRLLGLSGPDAPNSARDDITGGVDLLPWWAAAQEQTLNATITPGAAVLGFFGGITVPAGQRWLVTRQSAFGATVAGNTYVLVCAHQQLINPAVFMVGQVSNKAVFPGFAVAPGLQYRTEWILAAPTDVLGVFVVENVGAAPAAITFSASFLSFPA